MDFEQKLNQFFDDYGNWIDSLYRNGFEYQQTPIPQFVDPDSLRVDDETELRDTLFLWITKAICNLGEPKQVYILQGNNSDIQLALGCFANTLLRKHSNYGNSALAPNLFYRGIISPADGILIRLSDKVKRIEALLQGEPDKVGESVEDTTRDFVGYIILLYIALFVDGNTLMFDRLEPTGERPVPALIFPYRPTYKEIKDTVESGNFDVMIMEAVKDEQPES